MRRTMRRAGVLVAACAVAVLALAAPASAHVTVNPDSATQGGFAKLTFRVPNEEDSATTTTVEVNVPQDAPIASIEVKPVTGWTAVVTKSKLAKPVKDDDGNEITEAVTKIVWTASADAGIKPGEFQEFDLSAGPLPDSDQVVFKALQTYSNGDIVRWIDETKAGQPEPDHPAPTLKLTKATGDAGAAAGTSGTTSSGSNAGVILGVLGLLFGLAGLAAGLLAYRKASTPAA